MTSHQGLSLSDNWSFRNFRDHFNDLPRNYRAHPYMRGERFILWTSSHISNDSLGFRYSTGSPVGSLSNIEHWSRSGNIWPQYLPFYNKTHLMNRRQELEWAPSTLSVWAFDLPPGNFICIVKDALSKLVHVAFISTAMRRRMWTYEESK